MKPSTGLLPIRRTMLLLLMEATWFLGCSSVDQSQPTRRTTLPELPVIALAAPEIVIGASDAPGDEFAMPMLLTGDTRGSVYVYDVRLVELTKYDQAGRFQLLVAKRGQGPGDVHSVSSVITHQDTVMVWDGRLGRMLMYSLDGEYLGQIHTELQVSPSAKRSSSLVGIAENGDMFVRIIEEPASTAVAERPIMNLSIIRMPRNGTPHDTLIRYQAPAGSLTFHSGGSRVTTPGPHLGSTVLYDPSTQTFVQVDRGMSSAEGTGCICIQRLSAAGEVKTTRKYEVAVVPIEDAVREEFHRRVRRLQAGGGLFGSAGKTPSMWDSIAGVIGDYPAVKRAYIGEGGSVWLNLYSAGSEKEQWLVLDKDLNAVKRLEVPGPINEPAIANGHLWGTAERDEVPVIIRTAVTDVF